MDFAGLLGQLYPRRPGQHRVLERLLEEGRRGSGSRSQPHGGHRWWTDIHHGEQNQGQHLHRPIHQLRVGSPPCPAEYVRRRTLTPAALVPLRSYVMVVPIPKKAARDLFAFLAPFDWTLWVSILACKMPLLWMGRWNAPAKRRCSRAAREHESVHAHHAFGNVHSNSYLISFICAHLHVAAAISHCRNDCGFAVLPHFGGTAPRLRGESHLHRTCMR